MRRISLFLTIFSFVILFAACSSDDNNDPTPPVDTVKFDGVFKGDLAISMGDLELDNSKNKIEIIKTGEGKATLQLKNFKFQVLEIGDIIVKDVVVTEKNKVATLKGEANLKLEVGDCVVVVDATVEGDKLIAEIHVDVTPPNEGGSQSSKMKIKVNFDGNRFDGVESSEAKLLSFNLKDIDVISSTIDGETVTLFIAKADGDKIKEAQPVATFSEKATISPSLDKKQDFTEPVVYTVTAEDGITTTKYTVKTTVSNIGSVVAFDFSKSIDAPYESEFASNISQLPDTIENFYWGSSDGGMVMVLAFDDLAEKFSVTQVDEDNDFGGPVFRIETQNTVGLESFMPGFLPAVPKITSGSLFLGGFELNPTEPLKSTSFGVVVENKPLVVSGTLSYKSGEEYYHCPNPAKDQTHLANLVEGKKDEGIISAVVYEVANADETLDGTNIYNSPKVIATSSQTFSDGFKGDFTFDIEYSKDFDPAKTYKLAIMLSASIDGDKFSGAGGSVLKISKLEVGFE